MADQVIPCKDCGADFVFTESDQEFFKEKAYSPPKRCKACRQAKKAQQAGEAQQRGGVDKGHR
jgi:uncharacterized Zn finger protein